MRLALFVALSALLPATAADPPGLAVASSDPQVSQPTGSITVSSGRFVPLAVAGGKPSLVLGNEAGLVELFTVTPSTELVGVRYDEPAGAKAKRYTFGKKDVTHIAIAGDVGGVVKLTAIVNGATPTSPPSISGELVLTLTGPRPPPKPEPQPQPVTGKLYGWVWLEETANASAQRGKILTDAIVWSDANGIKHRVGDKTTQPADLVPYFNRTGNAPLPRVFLVTDKGGILFEGDGPADLKTLLEKYK